MSWPRPLIGLGCLVAAGLVPGGVAWAQAVAGERPLTADVHVREEYDSNLSGGNDAFAALRDVSSSDWITSLGAAVDANLASGRRLLTLQASTDVVRYRRNSQLNNVNANFSGRLSQGFGACVANLDASYSRRLTPGDQLIIAVTKNISSQENVGLGAVCTRGHLQAGVQGHYVHVSNSAQSSGVLSYDGWGANGTLGYTDRFLGSISLLGGYNEVSYTNPSTATPLFVSGYKTTDFGVQYSRQVGLRLSGSASVTYQTADNDFGSFDGLFGAGRESHSAFAANVAMSYRLGPRTQLDFSYFHGATPETQLNTGFNVSDTFMFSASHTLGERIRLSASASQAKTNYGGVLIDGEAPLESDRVRRFSGAASLRIGRHLRLSVDAEHENRTANVSIYTYAADRVGISLAGEL
jgi:hypothetical protein